MTEKHFRKHNPLAIMAIAAIGGAMLLAGCATNRDGTQRTMRNRMEEMFGVARGGQMDVDEGSYMDNLPVSRSGVSVDAQARVGQGRRRYGGAGVPGVDEPIGHGVPDNVYIRGRAGAGDNYTDGDIRTTERRRYRRDRDDR